jgi:exosortase family protein XrtM
MITRPIRYLTLFVGAYVLLETCYFLVPDSILRNVVYHYGIVVASADVIHLITPHEWVTAIANRLNSERLVLEVIRGCDGAGVAFLLIAAMVAFPAGRCHKVTGSVTALVLVFLLNQVRIVGLYYIGAYQKDWFGVVHTYLAPTLMVAVASVYFTWWITRGRMDLRGTSRAT